MAPGYMQSLFLTLVSMTSPLSPNLLNSSFQHQWPISDLDTPVSGVVSCLSLGLLVFSSFLFGSGTYEFPYLVHLAMY